MPPGQKIAATSINPGENDRYAYARGTSNAAALGTRGAAQIFEVLNELREETPSLILGQELAGTHTTKTKGRWHTSITSIARNACPTSGLTGTRIIAGFTGITRVTRVTRNA
jgi:hypothetical protein